MAVSRMRNENMQYNLFNGRLAYFYRNSSVIVDLAMGQAPRSTERISSSVFYVRISIVIALSRSYREG